MRLKSWLLGLKLHVTFALLVLLVYTTMCIINRWKSRQIFSPSNLIDSKTNNYRLTDLHLMENAELIRPIFLIDISGSKRQNRHKRSVDDQSISYRLKSAAGDWTLNLRRHRNLAPGILAPSFFVQHIDQNRTWLSSSTSDKMSPSTNLNDSTHVSSSDCIYTGNVVQNDQHNSIGQDDKSGRAILNLCRGMVNIISIIIMIIFVVKINFSSMASCKCLREPIFWSRKMAKTCKSRFLLSLTINLTKTQLIFLVMLTFCTNTNL